VISGCEGWGLVCISPGNKKVAGETLRDALMPLQPVPINAKTGMIANLRIFQLNRTFGAL